MEDMVTGGRGVGTQFELLGVHYECGTTTSHFAKEKTWQLAHWRCNRIKYAARRIEVQRKLVKMFVLLEVLRGTAWEKPPAESLVMLLSQIDMCVRGKWGGVNARSKLLVWETSLGPRGFLISMLPCAIGVGQRRVRRQL